MIYLHVLWIMIGRKWFILQTLFFNYLQLQCVNIQSYTTSTILMYYQTNLHTPLSTVHTIYKVYLIVHLKNPQNMYFMTHINDIIQHLFIKLKKKILVKFLKLVPCRETAWDQARLMHTRTTGSQGVFYAAPDSTNQGQRTTEYRWVYERSPN